MCLLLIVNLTREKMLTRPILQYFRDLILMSIANFNTW